MDGESRIIKDASRGVPREASGAIGRAARVGGESRRRDRGTRVDEGGKRTGGARGPGAIASKTKFQRVNVFFCHKPARLQNVLYL